MFGKEILKSFIFIRIPFFALTLKHSGLRGYDLRKFPLHKDDLVATIQWEVEK